MTEDQRRYRGDWILHALVDEHHGMTPWERLDGRPPGLPTPRPGRFDLTTNQWDYDAGPRGGPPPPVITRVAIPPEDRIGYTGETLYLRRIDLEAMLDQLHQHGVLWAFREYARDPTYAVARFWPSDGMVRWSRSIPHDLRAPLAKVVTILSDVARPRQLVGGNY